MSSIPIKVKTGRNFLEQDELGIGQMVWDTAHPIVHRFGGGSGEINPRFYPGVDKLGNLFMEPGTYLKPFDASIPEHSFGYDGGDLVFKAYGKEVFRANQLGLQVTGLVSQNGDDTTFLPSQSGLSELLFPLVETSKTFIAQFTRPAIAAVSQDNKFYTYRSIPQFLQEFSGNFFRGGSADSGFVRQVGGNLAYQPVLGNQPRITYSLSTGKCRGLLIEPDATNAVTQSFTIDTWPVQSSITWTHENNASWATKGLNPPNYFVEAAANAEHSTSQTISLDPAKAIGLSVFFQGRSVSTAHGLSFFVGTPDRSHVFGINISVSANGVPTVNSTRLLGNGVLNSSEIEPVGLGIYRLKLTGLVNPQSTAGVSALQVTLASLGSAQGNTALVFTPGSNDGNWCLLGDVQAEQNSVVTSYIPTTTTPLTRNRDLLSINLTKLKYSPVEGQFEFGFRSNGTLSVGAVLFSLVNNDGSSRLDYYVASSDSTNYTIGTNFYQSGQTTVTNPSVATVPLLRSKLTITYVNLQGTFTQLTVDGSRGFFGTVSLISYE